MNGAETLVKTLLGSDVNVCFANPGTSEMHFVAALDNHPEMRCILCLFEGGATGAADGYFRMSGNIAATLLHLAPGLANGFANLHNARKAGSGIITIVGDHASWHLKYESPLRGDVEGVSRAISHWTRIAADAGSVAGDGAAAIRAARSNGGQLATLILPANTAWEEAAGAAISEAPAPAHRPGHDEIRSAARKLKLPGAALLIDGLALHGDLCRLAARIAAKTGCRLMAPYFAARIERGAGSVALTRLAYVVEENTEVMADVTCLVLCGSAEPANFFAYPGKPSLPASPDCEIVALCGRDMDYAWTLQALANELDANATPIAAVQPLDLPEIPTGSMSLEKIGLAIAALLPENAIVIDESITAARALIPPMLTARPHDLLQITGGAIGQGLPTALGAAVACPDRKVVALSGDGSAMYTLQALWTMAREKLDVTTIIFANRGYQILRGELANVGVTDVGRNAIRMFDVVEPTLDWVALAKGHGVPGTRVSDTDEFVAAFKRALSIKGPFLIEVVC